MSKKKYLLLKGCAGLGNRIFCLIEAIHYAERTHRHLIIDWNDGMYFSKGYNFFSDYFYLESTDYSSPNSADLVSIKHNFNNCYPDVINSDIEKDIYYSYKQVRNKTIIRIATKFGIKGKLRGHWALNEFHKGKTDLDFISFIYSCLRRDSLALGEFLSERHQEDLVIFADYTPNFKEKLFNERFRFQNTFLERLKSKEIFNSLNQCVGVHIRNTDLKPTKSIESLVSYLNQTHREKPIFLATDSKMVESYFKKNFILVFLNNKNLPSKEIALHKLTGQNDHSEAVTDFENSLADLYYLANCNYLYYQGNSSFSIIAKNLGKSQSFDWLKLDL